MCRVNDVKPAIRAEVVNHCKSFLLYHPGLRSSVLGMSWANKYGVSCRGIVP